MSQTNLAAYEYWFNHDFENRQSQNIAPTQQNKLNTAIDVSTLPDGVNLFNIRYIDENGLASSTVRKMFYKNTQLLYENNNLSRYEYWFNHDFENRQGQDIAVAQQNKLNTAIDVSTLPDGVNLFNIRYIDENGLASSAVRKMFYKNTQLLHQNKKLIAYEYWFNKDIQNRIEINTSSDAKLNIISNIDASSLPEGFNVFHVRVKDETGSYSSTFYDYFYRKPLGTITDNRLTAYEYWFNNDYVNRVEEAFTPVTNHDLLTNIDASALNEGLNVFNIRFKDENGAFSTTLTEYFYRTAFTDVTSNRMIAYEYWFNNNYESRVEEAFAPTENLDLLTNVDASSLTEGLNVFNIRFKDEKGTFSTTLTEFFYKNPHAGLSSNKIYAYRYRVEETDGTPVGQPLGEYTRVNLPEPSNPAIINFEIEVLQLQKGNYHFVFETLDSLGFWSVTTSDLFEKTAFPIALFEPENYPVCSNSAVRFINQSIDADTCLWDFGDGQTSREWEPEHIFATAGQYEVFLTATDSVSGRDSTISRIIEVLPSALGEESLEICQGDTLHWNGFEYTQTGDYEVALGAANACDSLVTLHLTVHPTFTNITAPCNYLKRTVNAYPETSDILANVQNEYGTTYSVADWNGLLAIADIDNWISCMGLQNLDWFLLTVNGQRKNGNRHYFVQYFPDGVPGYFAVHDQIANKLFLGSWYDIEMPILARNNEPIPTTSVCSTELPFVFGTQNLSESGQYSETFQTIHGCDSIVTINLDVKQGWDLIETIELCQSELPYQFGTQTLTETGVYTESWPLPNGCDSTITLDFIVHPEYDIEARKAICIDSTYHFGTQLISEAGVYEELFQSVYGCDSLVSLTVQTVPGNIGVFDTIFVSPADECFNGFYTITIAGDGYPVVVESGAYIHYIAGQSILFLPGFHARTGSNVNAYISTEPWYCDEASQAIVLAEPANEPFAEKSFQLSDSNPGDENLLEQSMKVYPNPNNGIFTLQFTNIESNTQVYIFNALGQKVYETSVNGENLQLAFPGIKRGMYLLKAFAGQKQFGQKIMVQ